MDPTNTDLRALLPQLTADAARELAREQDEQGDVLKRQAKALFAYADALGDGADDPVAPTAPTPPAADDTPGPDGGRDARHAPPSDKKPLIRDLIAERPLPGWNPDRVHSTLIDRGLIPPETTKPSIGVTMRRMYSKYRELAKTPDGLYTTPENGELYQDEPNPFAGDEPRVAIAVAPENSGVGEFAIPD